MVSAKLRRIALDAAIRTMEHEFTDDESATFAETLRSVNDADSPDVIACVLISLSWDLEAAVRSASAAKLRAREYAEFVSACVRRQREWDT